MRRYGNQVNIEVLVESNEMTNTFQGYITLYNITLEGGVNIIEFR